MKIENKMVMGGGAVRMGGELNVFIIVFSGGV